MKYISKTNGSMFDIAYTNNRIYDVKPSDPDYFEVVSDTGEIYHPYKNLFIKVEDECGNCSSSCRRVEGICSLYME